MKLTKVLLIAILLHGTFYTQAQIKIQYDGQVSIGTFSSSTLSGVQIEPKGCSHFNSSSTADWNWVTLATPRVSTGKCWIVTRPGNKNDHCFFVSGYGYVYKRGSYTASDNSMITERDSITNPNAILDQITGFYYTPIDDSTRTNSHRRIGISAKEIEEVLPEAVTFDENGIYYLNYESLIPVLIEGYKKQQKEIDSLKVLLNKVVFENKKNEN